MKNSNKELLTENLLIVSLNKTIKNPSNWRIFLTPMGQIKKLDFLKFPYTSSTLPQAFVIFSWAEADTLSIFKVILEEISPSPKTFTL